MNISEYSPEVKGISSFSFSKTTFLADIFPFCTCACAIKSTTRLLIQKGEAKRQRRNSSLPQYFRHSLVSLGLAVVGVGVGIANFVVGADNGPWHLTGGSFIPGVMIGACAFLGYLLYQSGIAQQGNENADMKAKCLFISHYVMSLITAIISVAFIILPIVGIVWCSGEVEYYYVRINRITYKKNVTCPSNKVAAMVTGSLAAFDSLLIGVWCIIGTVFFCCFVRAFGFKGRHRYSYPPPNIVIP